MFQTVTRKKAKLRLALTGVSGAGKTLSALYIAYGMTGDWSKIALIDTEHERARFYANRSDLGTGEFLYHLLTHRILHKDTGSVWKKVPQLSAVTVL